MSNGKVLQIKITLEGIAPKIWRRFQIGKNITYHQLHKIIQAVMGWTDSHLYGFRVDDREYQDDTKDGMLDFDEEQLFPSRKHKISFRLKQKFRYTYDFGDCWEHLLVVEKILPKAKNVSYPVCLEGERNCPPEDCGSVSGYYNLMAVRKNKKHPEYEALIKEWLGEGYDPEYFNVQEVNAELRNMFKKSQRKPSGRSR